MTRKGLTLFEMQQPRCELSLNKEMDLSEIKGAVW